MALVDAMLPGIDDGALDADDEVDEELARKMQESLALNAQLKEMLRAAEGEQMLQRQQVQQQRQQHSMMLRQPQARTAASSIVGARAKNGGWGGQTHTETRATEIHRDNQILVTKLSAIAGDRRRPLVAGPPARRVAVSSTQINRRKQDDRIARENAALAKRLGSVKATKGLSSKDAKKNTQEHQKRLEVLRQPTPQLLGTTAAPLARRQPSTLLQRRPTAGALDVVRPRDPFT